MEGTSSRKRSSSSRTTATHQNTSQADANAAMNPAAWNVFNQHFRRVQWILDRNRILIHRVNQNHQSKLPENMVKNVALIKEINDNIAKVTAMYSNLSVNFASACQRSAENNDPEKKTD